jgi:hypothetical protein
MTELGNGEVVFLTLRATSYQINRGPNSATGKISVEGDQIAFFDGSVCDERGSYTWSFDGDSLTLAVADGDPCSGRTPVLDQVTYTLQF